MNKKIIIIKRKKRERKDWAVLDSNILLELVILLLECPKSWN